MTGDAALEALLRSVPWSGLLHAYGRATDTPDHLRALARPEAEGRKAALQHLGSAILHQGTPWTATPPVAQTVPHLLAQPALDVGSERPVRLPLLGFLTGVAEVVPASGLAREELLEMAGACDLAPWLATGDDEALAAAFPPDRAPTAPLTPAQRRYLRALVDNAALWDPRFGNAIRWFQRAGLPCEREACARLLG